VGLWNQRILEGLLCPGNISRTKHSFLNQYMYLFNQVYGSTTLENYMGRIVVDGTSVDFALTDTGDLKSYDYLRPLAYPDTHVVLICFAIDSPDSLDNVQEKGFLISNY
jgi:GTPase SAR1 family protein